MANNNDKFISRENAKTLWGYMIDLLTGKQNKLTFDETPTQSSDNPVKSGGIFTALAGKGTYSKPQNGIPKTDLENAVQTSLGLADSALQSETDPTVPSWAKQSSKPSYNSDEISDTNRTHKFATQEQLNQISTNQTNILYGIKTGAKNQLKLTGDVWNPNTVNVYWDYTNGTVRVVGSSATTAAVFIKLGSWTAPEDNVYRLYANGLACTANIRIYDDASWTTYAATSSESNEATWTKGTTRQLYLRIASGVVVGDITVTPMICPKSIFDADPTFAPHAFPNSDLTALAEVVDSGAKNLLQLAATTNTSVSGCHVTFSGTASASATQWYGVEFKVSTSGSYVFAVKATSGTIPTTALYNITDDVNVKLYDNGTGGNDTVYLQTGKRYKVGSYLHSGTSYNQQLDVMICTLADWKVSHKCVPYRPDWDSVGVTVTSLWKDSFSTVSAYSNNVTNIEGGYSLIGKLVVVNIRCTLSPDVNSWIILITGLPKPSVQYNTGNGAVCLAINKGDSAILTGQGAIGVTGNISSGETLLISGTYIAY